MGAIGRSRVVICPRKIEFVYAHYICSSRMHGTTSMILLAALVCKGERHIFACQFCAEVRYHDAALVMAL